MLNRNKSPNMGLWNGVGGKIEIGETPMEGILREVLEETGISLSEDDVTFAGDVIWESEEEHSGMYVFLAELPEEIEVPTPQHTEEGILEWKEIDWILDTRNRGVVENIKMYLPKMLEGQLTLQHIFFYEGDTLVGYTTSEIENKTLIKV